jgi:hypothetical protein
MLHSSCFTRTNEASARIEGEELSRYFLSSFEQKLRKKDRKQPLQHLFDGRPNLRKTRRPGKASVNAPIREDRSAKKIAGDTAPSDAKQDERRLLHRAVKTTKFRSLVTRGRGVVVLTILANSNSSLQIIDFALGKFGVHTDVHEVDGRQTGQSAEGE